MGKNLLESVYSFGNRNVRPPIMVWLWGICLVAQLAQTSLYWTWSGPDRNRQLVAASQAVEGVQYSEPIYQPSSNEVIHQPLTHWAPGYSVIAAWVHFVVSDWMMISQIISLLAVLLVFFGLWKLMNVLREWIPWPAEAFLLVFWMCAFAPFRYFNDTDLLSLGCGLLASAILLNRNSRWPAPIVATGLMFLAAWFRIAYVPFMLIPAIFYLLTVGFKRRAPWIAFAAGLAGILLYWSLFSPSHPVSGGATDVLTSGNFFPENLLSFDAFPVKAWLYLSTEAAYNKAGSWGAMMMAGFLIVLSLAFVYRLTVDLFSTESKDSLHEVTVLMVIVIVLVSGELAWLSIKTPKEIHDGIRTWTYVQETRYFAWPMILSALWTVRLVYSHRKPGFVQKILRIGLIVSLLVGWTHGAYRHVAAAVFPSHHGTRWSEEELAQRAFYQQVTKLAETQEVYIFTGSSIAERDAASLGVLAGGTMVEDTTDFPSDRLLVFPQK